MLFRKNQQVNIIENWNRRWPNFSPREVLGKTGYKVFLDRGEIMIAETAMDKLEEFRRHLGNAVIFINSGYRTPEENMKAEGKPFSRHIQGLAFDIRGKALTPKELYDEAVNFGWRGVGLYDSFVHIDWRPLLGGAQRKWDLRRK